MKYLLSAKEYVFKKFGWLDIEKSSINKSIKYAVNYSKGILIDIGCGDKPYKTLFDNFVKKYYGIENYEVFKETENIKNAVVDVYYSGSVLPIKSLSVDTILCTQVLEHTDNPWKLMEEFNRILKKDGILILTVPFSYKLHMIPNDYYRFTLYGLKHLSEKANFEILYLQTRGGLWAVVGHKISQYLFSNIGHFDLLMQEMGCKKFEKKFIKRPRIYLAPILLPLIIFVVGLFLSLDNINFIGDDTLGYLLVAKKKSVY